MIQFYHRSYFRSRIVSHDFTSNNLSGIHRVKDENINTWYSFWFRQKNIYNRMYRVSRLFQWSAVSLVTLRERVNLTIQPSEHRRKKKKLIILCGSLCYNGVWLSYAFFFLHPFSLGKQSSFFVVSFLFTRTGETFGLDRVKMKSMFGRVHIYIYFFFLFCW